MPTLYGVTSILMWGMLASTSVITKHIPPFQLLALCLLIAASLLFVKRAIKKEALLKPPQLSVVQWLVGIAGIFGFHLCYFMAIRFAPPVEVSLIGYLWPLLLGIFVAHRSARKYALLGGIIGFGGCSYMLLAQSQLQISGDHTLGFCLAGLCALIWSTYSWYLSTSTSDGEEIGWICAASAILSFLCHLAFESHSSPFTTSTWIAVLFLGLGPVGGAFYLWDIGMKHGNKTLLSSLSFATPIISTIALAMLGLGQLSPAVIVATLLVTAGAVITQVATKQVKRSEVHVKPRSELD